MQAPLLDYSAARVWVHDRQARNRTVVFTNGCFDLLHPGHVHLLTEARKLGDCLLVGMNSDRSIVRLKGAQRPIFAQAQRIQVLQALRPVDAVVVFPIEPDDETRHDSVFDTPYQLLETIKPDVLVKGGDYQPADVIGAELVNRVHIIPLLAGFSTSGIVQKLISSEGN